MEKFSYEKNGYSRSDVNKFISEVIEETEKLISVVKKQKTEIEELKNELNHYKNSENTLNSLYLIAARNKIRCSFDEYIKIIKSEFSRTTIKEDQSQLLVNLRGRVPMKVSNIEEGINLGINLIKEEKVKCLVKSLENKIKQI